MSDSTSSDDSEERYEAREQAMDTEIVERFVEPAATARFLVTSDSFSQFVFPLTAREDGETKEETESRLVEYQGAWNALMGYYFSDMADVDAFHYLFHDDVEFDMPGCAAQLIYLAAREALVKFRFVTTVPYAPGKERWTWKGDPDWGFALPDRE